MKRLVAVTLLSAAVVVLSGMWTVVSADGTKSDFALFDGTNPVNASPNTGAVCQAKLKKAFTYHVAVTNYGTAGVVRIRYADGDQVDYKIPVDGSFSLSQAAGSKGGADRAVRVCGANGAILVGSMSALSEHDDGAKLSCVSCDAPANGGVGDAACTAIVSPPGPIGPFTCP